MCSQPIQDLSHLKEDFEWNWFPKDLNQIIQDYAWGRFTFVTEWKISTEQTQEEIINPVFKRYSYDKAVKMLKTLGDADQATMCVDLEKACFLIRAEFQYHDKCVDVLFVDGRWEYEGIVEWANVYTFLHKHKGHQEEDQEEHQAMVNDLICAFAKRFVYTQPCKEETWFTLKYQAERWKSQASKWRVFESQAPFEWKTKTSDMCFTQVM